MKLKIFLVVLAFSLSAWAGTVACTVDCGGTCSASSVNSAVSAAGVNGTVTVPAGSCTWTGTVSATRGVRIVGAGAGSSVITEAGTLFNWTPSATALSNGEVFELSGFTLDGNNVSNNTLIRLVGPDLSGGPSAPALVNIHDNTIRNAGQGASSTVGYATIYSTGTVYGPIHDNVFDRNCLLLQNMGDTGGSNCNGYYHWKYNTGFKFGDKNSLYFEHNTMQYSSADSTCATVGENNWIESGWGAPGIVVRYNTLDSTNIGTAYNEELDFHGLQPPTSPCTQGNCPAQKAEYYGNIYTNQPSGRFLNWRGSMALAFNNTVNGSSFPVLNVLGASNAGCQSDSSCTTAFGAGSVPALDPNNGYFWNNIENGTVENMVMASGNTTCGCKENSNWWNFNSSCSGTGSCTAGIGVGTSAPTGTCTNGTGFWVWADGTKLPTDIPTMIAATQAGTFYKCVGGTWTQYYKPYTYPYPITGGQTGAPAPPTNLQVIVQ